MQLCYVPVLNKDNTIAHSLTAEGKESFNYITKPLEFIKDSKFDIIFIDGVDRHGCASMCSKLGHKETLIFFHDYNRDRIPDYNGKALQIRETYFLAEKYLIPIEGVLTMYKLKIRWTDNFVN